MTSTLRSVEAAILSALATVLDPELDQPVTELGFV
ncbi:iron-sulfur cluster assembly protein, partial [Amycolatopsis rhizosphaerae]